MTSSPAAEALSVIVPSGRLPWPNPFVRRFDAVAHRVAHQMEHRVHHALDQVLVDLRGLALEEERHLAAGFPRQVAHDERHASKDLANRYQADAHEAFAQRSQLAIDRDGVFLRVTPFRRRHVGFDS